MTTAIKKLNTLLRHIFRNNLYTISLYIRKLAAAIVIFCLARYLPVSEYGLYSSYTNIAGVLLLITNFGFNEYIIVSSKSKLKPVRLKLSFFQKCFCS